MSTIYKCDGCDKEFKVKSGNLTEVTITFDRERDVYSESPPVEMDLCPTCATSFKRHIERILTDRLAAA